MDNLGYLFAANVFVWGGILFYLCGLRKRQQSLQNDLEMLKESIEGKKKSE